VKSNLQRIFLGAGILLLAFATHAGDIPYNNIGATSGGADVISSFGPLADSFNSGPTALTLNSIAVLLRGNSDSTGGVTMELLSNNDNTPGSVLDIIGTISSPTASSLVGVFVPSGTITLAANKTYWIELLAPGTDATGWFWSLDTSGPGVAGQFYSNMNGVFPNSDGPYQMEVSGTAVTTTPEPSSLLLFGTSLLGLAPFRRKLFGR
jgi:PEP-CTERM motif